MNTPTLEALRAEALASAYTHARRRQARRFGEFVAGSACMVDDAYAYLEDPASITDAQAVEFFREAEEYARGLHLPAAGGVSPEPVRLPAVRGAETDDGRRRPGAPGRGGRKTVMVAPLSLRAQALLGRFSSEGPEREELEAALRAVIEEERDACARIAYFLFDSPDCAQVARFTGRDIGDAIMRRGRKTEGKGDE